MSSWEGGPSLILFCVFFFQGKKNNQYSIPWHNTKFNSRPCAYNNNKKRNVHLPRSWRNKRITYICLPKMYPQPSSRNAEKIELLKIHNTAQTWADYWTCLFIQSQNPKCYFKLCRFCWSGEYLKCKPCNEGS